MLPERIYSLLLHEKAKFQGCPAFRGALVFIPHELFLARIPDLEVL
jgi:hypothetical protein